MTHIKIEKEKLEQWVKAVARYAPAGEGVFSAVMMAQDDVNEVLKQALAAPTVQEPRWYCVDKTGVAILCTDEDDAKQGAKQAEKAWPRFAPYRAVQLWEYTTPPAPVPLTDDVVQKIISKLEPLLDAKNQSWAEAERMLHGITKGQQ